MSNELPPSSPVKWYQTGHIYPKNNEIGLYQLDPFSDDNKQIIINANRIHPDRYPTPNPSSSIGITVPSSPVPSSIGTEDINIIENNKTTTNKHCGQEDLSELSPTEHINQTIPPNTANSIDTLLCDTIPIFISPNAPQHYILGRKSSICDIKLPHYKNISRQHTIISYNDKNKILYINCLGCNGMIISFQSDTDFSLERVELKDNSHNNNNNISKLFKISPHIKRDGKINDKLLKRCDSLISFSLLKNETVELPLINNTILDFKNCKCVIKLSQNDYHDTDTEDEFVLLPTKSDDFVHTPTKHFIPIYPHLDNSPATEKSSTINEQSSPSIFLKTPSPRPSAQQQYLQNSDLPYQQLPQTPIKKKYRFDTDVHSNILRLNNMESPIKRSSNSINNNISLPRILNFKTVTRTTARKKSFKFENHMITKPINSVDVSSNTCKDESPSTGINYTRIEKEQHLPVQESIKKINVSLSKSISALESSDNIESNCSIKNSVAVSSIRETAEDKGKFIEDSDSEQYLRTDKVSEECHPSSITSEGSHQEVKDFPTSKKRKLNIQLNTDKDAYTTQSLNEKNIDLKEIQKIIVDNIAFSNLKQTPLSYIMNINSITRSLPKSMIRSLMHDIPCIGEIKRYGKDAAGELLEADYYYDLENDDDEERRSIVISLKGGKNLGLRSCRKTHKQYYWKKPSKR